MTRFLWKARQWWFRRREARLDDARRIVVAAYGKMTSVPSQAISHAQSDQYQDTHRRLAAEIGREWGA